MAYAFALDRFPPSRLPLLASRLTRMMGRACRPLEVAAKSAIGKTRWSRVTRALCAQGYIEQRNVARDRRRVTLHVTPRGKEVCRALVELMLDLQAKLVGRIGNEDYKVFEQVLDAVESQPKAAEAAARQPTAPAAADCIA